ncbi:hypothetical protein [Mesorhizobium sp. M0898]|uniref:hypothetical protein n=1 Tax=Mesorhizobium sp. M0898 TaxID=2957020 RepID=UPI0033388FDC
MVLIDLRNYPLKGLDCTPRYLNMSSRGIDFSLAWLNGPNAGLPCFGIGDEPALLFELLAKFFSESLPLVYRCGHRVSFLADFRLKVTQLWWARKLSPLKGVQPMDAPPK